MLHPPAMHHHRFHQTALLFVETVRLRDKLDDVTRVLRETAATTRDT